MLDLLEPASEGPMEMQERSTAVLITAVLKQSISKSDHLSRRVKSQRGNPIGSGPFS